MRPKFTTNVVEIIHPAIGGEVTLDEYCTISTHGKGGEGLVAEVLEVVARVNGGSEETGVPNGINWSVGGVGKAGSYCTNTLEVKIRYRPTDAGGELWSDWTAREFVGVGGPQCYAYCGGETFVPGPSKAISVPLPRFVRLTVVTDVGSNSSISKFGGLVQKASVYLAYDPNSSSAYEAVWRDINLPHPLGTWTLRAWARGQRLVAELTWFQIDETYVNPPVIYRVSSWNPNGQNLLQADCTSCGKSLLKDAMLQLEPA